MNGAQLAGAPDVLAEAVIVAKLLKRLRSGVYGRTSRTRPAAPDAACSLSQAWATSDSALLMPQAKTLSSTLSAVMRPLSTIIE